MNKLKSLFAVLLLALLSSVAVHTVSANGPGNSDFGLSHLPVCGAAVPGDVRCNARVVVDRTGQPAIQNIPSGLSPAQFQNAYGVAGVGSQNNIIAVVDAYDDPKIASDLATYDRQFSLPDPTFLKVNQNGQVGNYPKSNPGWALEISLDVEVAHAMCPTCKLILVEANSASYSDLMTAVDTAKNLGARVISNSYGSSEFSGEGSFDVHFQDNTTTAFLFSSGDSGYGVQYPAASRYVTAVGGTSLFLSGSAYSSESVWNGAGSGCSAFESQPGFQNFLTSTCTNRVVADVSADADPNTGAAVYDSVRYQGRAGWFQVGGTSLAAPLVAGWYGVNGVPTDSRTSLYANAITFHDVISGSNGSCGGSLLCTGVVGYDGPTGVGTP
ncbi:MAG TPA: S53 family peptidase [Patescibacteria group bacterium]|nr:S53 family peptidase [Patescibacteria group bacterium]